MAGIDVINALLQTVTLIWHLHSLTENIFRLSPQIANHQKVWKSQFKHLSWKSSEVVKVQIEAANLKIII